MWNGDQKESEYAYQNWKSSLLASVGAKPSDAKTVVFSREGWAKEFGCRIKNIIKLDVMASDQASLDLYDVPFYKSKDIYLDQMQIQDLRQIYGQTS